MDGNLRVAQWRGADANRNNRLPSIPVGSGITLRHLSKKKGAFSMRIHVRSKSQVECGDVPDAPHVIVSIYTLESDRANTLKCKNAVDVLYQGFADLERLPALGSATEAYFKGVPIVLFACKHAREVKALETGCETF